MMRRGLHEEASSLPVPSFPRSPVPPSPPRRSSTHKPCPAPGFSRGPTVPLLHRSQNMTTLRRRPRLLEASSARLSTVPLPTRSSICAHFDCSVYSRFTHLVIPPMYGGAPQPGSSQRGGHQVVDRILHRGHVLVCDCVHRNEPPHSIQFLHR